MIEGRGEERSDSSGGVIIEPTYGHHRHRCDGGAVKGK